MSSSQAKNTQPDFTPNLIQPAGYLCYINGLRVPILGAMVSYGVGLEPSASIELFPSKHLQRLGAGDAVEVQLFYLDVFYSEIPEYRLLFDGYIVGWQYSSTAHGRSLNLQAVVDIARYRQANFEFLTTTEQTAAALAGGGQASQTIPVAGVFHPYALLKRGLTYPENEIANNKPVQVTITRPYEYLWNTVMSLCSTDLPNRVASIPVVNYFARWIRRRNFVNRVVAFPYFDDPTDINNGVFPLIKSVQSSEILAQIGATISSEVGQGGTLMDLLQRMLGAVYCELAMLPTPPAVRVDLDGVIQGPADKKTGEGYQPVRLANYFVKPQCIFGMVPTCNVLFPSQVSSISYQEDYNTQPTRIYTYDGYAMTVVPGAGANPIARSALAAAYPAQAQAAMDAHAGMQSDPNAASAISAITTGKNILVWPEEFFRGPVQSMVQTPFVLGLLQTIQDNAAKAAADAAAAATPSPVANPAAPAADPAADKQRAQLLRLSKLYAQYEYFRQRYANRGGAADLTFNPYVVPGFPCVVYDHRGSGYDQVGYVNNIQHMLRKGQLSTSINYSHGRTLHEFSADLKDDCDEHSRLLGSAPREVIDAVRQGFQDPTKAQEIYQRMFYPGQAVKAAVNPLELVEYMDGTQPNITGTTETDLPLRTDPQPGQGPLAVGEVDTTSVKADEEVRARPQYAELFAGHDKAMTFTARPICSMSDYLLFIHGGQQSAEVQGLRETPVRANKTAKYYDQIFSRAVHTGPAPTDAQTGVAVTPQPGVITPLAVVNSASASVTTVSHKATIKDWSDALKKYREEIESSQLLIE